ncbi:MAG: thiamine monophosphate kinase [Ramlibacter sp.]|nr:thiamine monophosphate kinase [Ramlibacter sp.]
MGEFDLIARYFTRPARRSPLGVGDDCALLQPRSGMQLAVSTDLLLEGRHFLSTVDPARLGHKALAVNLSDLAACGAEPLAFTLAIALPRVDEAWLAAFAAGLLALADAHACELVGGDTTRGPLAIDITAEAFRGTVSLPQEVFDAARARLEMPQPRIALGLALRGIATSAIDISDGLLADLGHVLRKSAVGATVEARPACALLAAARGGWAAERERIEDLVFAGGDDYELAFTAPPAARDAVQAAAAQSGTPVARIGLIESQPGLRVVGADGRPLARRFAGFDHFGS